MRVLFTHSYFLKFDPKQWNTMQPYAPLGTIYAAALLREQGHEVSLHDVMFEDGPESIISKLSIFRPDVLVIYDDGFNYLTKMCLTNMRKAAFRMSEIGKEYGCKVIISSSDSTDHYEQYLQHKADYVILGEGEQTLLELVDSFKNHEIAQGNIAGLALLEDRQAIRTGSRTLISDLDTLPNPAWDLVNVDAYRQAWLNSTGYFSINMSTTRGCPFKCNWCAKPIYGNRYNARTPEHVVEELMVLYDTYKFDHVWFCDDIFGLKPGWVAQFSKLIAEKGLNFRFKIQSRADLMLKDEQIEHLSKAGCEIVWMGAESGSQKILDAMDKGTTVNQIKEATHLLKKNGIKPAFFLQFGYLGETMEDIQMTLDMVKELVPAEIGVSVSYPLPGTKFYEKVRSQLKEKTNWTDSDELAMMFGNTYKPEFYKRLHRYVHAFYRKTRAVNSINGFKDIVTIFKLPYYILQLMQLKRKMLNVLE